MKTKQIYEELSEELKIEVSRRLNTSKDNLNRLIDTQEYEVIIADAIIRTLESNINSLKGILEVTKKFYEYIKPIKP